MIANFSTKLNWKQYGITDFSSFEQDKKDKQLYTSTIGETTVYYFTDENGDVNHTMIINEPKNDSFMGKMQACALAWALEPQEDVSEIINKIDDIFSKQTVGQYGNSAVMVSSGAESILISFIDSGLTTTIQKSARKIPSILKRK